MKLTLISNICLTCFQDLVAASGPVGYARALRSVLDI